MTQALLILDLDETLIFGTRTPLERAPDLIVHAYAIYQRPHLSEFVARVRADYRLAVWTASTESYADPVVNCVLPPDLRLEFLWCRDRCKWRQNLETRQEYWLKDLKKLQQQGYDLDRVLFVDDKPQSLERNYSNHIAVTPYTGDLNDRELLHLAEYLTRVAHLPNLRSIEKRGWRSREPDPSQGVMPSRGCDKSLPPWFVS